MAIGDSLRFRFLLDLGSFVLSVVDQVSVRLRFPRNRSALRQHRLPDIGTAVRIPCAKYTLQGRFAPADERAAGSVLLLHGIGDRLYYWRKVQQRLANAGVHSLVFHYSGYGESELHRAAQTGGAMVELKIFPGYSHGETHLAAPQDYWDAVIAFVSNATMRMRKER